MTGTIWALLPPAVALVAALATRRVVPSLLGGALLGSMGLAAEATGLWSAPWQGVLVFVGDGLLGRLASDGNAQLLLLVALIGGFVGLLERSGAAAALVRGLSVAVTTPRRAELAAWLSGLLLFFSDTGNVLILGPVYRPLFDRLGVSRERLAWIIDATAAPVSVLVPFITWGVYITGLLSESFGRGLDLFVAAVPWQLYPWLSIASVGVIAASGRHLGPMARTRAVSRNPPAPHAEGPSEATPSVPASVPAWVGVAPLVVLSLTLVAVGGTRWSQAGILAGPDVRLALATAYLAATGCLWLSLRDRSAATAHAARGVAGSTRLMAVLMAAWTLAWVCRSLQAGEVVAAGVGPWLPVAGVPVALFAAAATVSFATGTSWGTFAILLPLAAALHTDLGVPAELLVGAVLSGGVFGDHSSPLSDTTLLASGASGVAHAEHVRTQLPYALAVGAMSAAGFVAAGLALGPAPTP